MPSYEQKRFDDGELANVLRVVASPDGESGSLQINQDVKIYLSKLSDGKSVDVKFESGRHGWLQVLRGSMQLNDVELGTSDGAAMSEEKMVTLAAMSDSEVLFFDLA